MNEIFQLTELLNKKEKLVAMLAPSFPVVYEYPKIISQLKKLGFCYVIEVSVGAKKTNEDLIKLLKENPESRFITSPCAVFFQLIKEKYPYLLKYLTLKADSPMIQTAKIIKEKYPGYRPVFIGPCMAKKLESSELYPELNILVVTYEELDKIFENFKVAKKGNSTNNTFDISEQTTRIYPIDGGLTETSGARNILKDDEIKIISGVENCETILSEFEKDSKIRLLDILLCEGGCINGQGITSNLSLEERKRKILEYSKLKH